MTPNFFLNRNDTVLNEDREVYEKLSEIQVPEHQELLKERSLYNVKISPIRYLGSFLFCRHFLWFLLDS